MATDDNDRPNLAAGVHVNLLRPGGMLVGHVGGDDVLLARVGDEFFAVGAHCTHYRGALAEGVMTGDTVRCPLHHSCFSLRTGEAMSAPALDPLARWNVERRDDQVYVREKLPSVHPPAPVSGPHVPSSVVIIGGGGAGLAA